METDRRDILGNKKMYAREKGKRERARKEILPSKIICTSKIWPVTKVNEKILKYPY
jgi:hypothetical protein